MSYIYTANLDSQSSFSQLEIQLDNGSSAILVKGGRYDLTAGELARAGRYISLVFSALPAVDQPIGIVRLPVKGNPTSGQIPQWDATEGAFTPATISGLSGGPFASVASLNALQAEVDTLESRTLVTVLSTEVASLQQALTDVAAAGGGTVFMRRNGGSFAIPTTTKITVPNGVALKAEGERSGVVLQLADASSGVVVQGRGGKIEGFTIDGGGVATEPLKFDSSAAQRVFDLDVRASGGHSCIFTGAQNCRGRLQTDRSVGSALNFRRGARSNYIDLYAEKFTRYAVENFHGLDATYPTEPEGTTGVTLENHVFFGPWERAGYANDGDCLGLVGLFGGTLFVSGGEWNLTGKADGTYRPAFHMAYNSSVHGGNPTVNRLVVDTMRVLSNDTTRPTTVLRTDTKVGGSIGNHEVVFDGYCQFQGLSRGYHVTNATAIDEIGPVVFNTIPIEFGNNTQVSTGDTASGSPTLSNITPTTGWANGDVVTGPGIPAGTTITAGAGTATMTMSANATATATGVTITGGSSRRDVIVRGSRKGGLDFSWAAGTVRGIRTKFDADSNYRVHLGPDRIYMSDASGSVPTSFPSIVPFTGSPEGAVSARIGTIGLRVDGSAGLEVYKKASGTGVSGWAPMTQVRSTQTIATDANFTLTPMTSAEHTLHTGPLTADRTITLSASNVQDGFVFRVTRTGGGAFNLIVGGLKNLATGQWCEVTRIGGAWVLTAFGSL